MNINIRRINPGNKVLVVLTVLLVISIGGGAATIYYTYGMQKLFDSALGRDIVEFNAAKELEIALLNQKGFATYFFLDGDPEWLGQLELNRKAFETWFQKAREYAEGGIEKGLLQKIESEYIQYVISKEKVISHYRSGDRDKGAELHWEVRKRFFELYGLCEQFKEIIEDKIASVRNDARTRAKWFSGLAIAAMMIALFLGLILAFILLTQILGPIRRLAMVAGLSADEALKGDEVEILRNRIHGLIEDVGQTKTELQKSRERLLQSEKMAVLGKLAADMAHSIRNPMTSIKMRLFSLQRNIELSPTQKEDLDVVSEEMRRLDNIVRNFLEFSRPPRLKMHKLNVSEILDMSLQLLQHRFEQYDVRIERHQHDCIPEVEADPELLKEVLVNLMVNALEAMKDGGTLKISEEEAVAEEIGRAVLIRLKDTGPGIPDSIRNKVWEPFFSTKEDGTGLGLPTAVRIIEEHGGRLNLRSREGLGATFTVTLPIKENNQ